MKTPAARRRCLATRRGLAEVYGWAHIRRLWGASVMDRRAVSFAGHTMQTLSAEVGCTKSTVRHAALMHHVPMPPPHGGWGVEPSRTVDPQTWERFDWGLVSFAGRGRRTIAADLGCTRRTAVLAARRYHWPAASAYYGRR